jgi:hypothetical protein
MPTYTVDREWKEEDNSDWEYETLTFPTKSALVTYLTKKAEYLFVGMDYICDDYAGLEYIRIVGHKPSEFVMPGD